MRAYIFFALFATISFAYKPDWKNCSTASDPWQPTLVFLAQELKANQINMLLSCGRAQKETTVSSFKLRVNAGIIPIYSTDVPLSQEDLVPSQDYCFTYNFFVPAIFEGSSFTVSFVLQDEVKHSIGCFHFPVDL